MQVTYSKLPTLFVLVCVLTLSACGGGTAGNSTTPPLPTPPVTPPPTQTITAQSAKTCICDGFTVSVKPYALDEQSMPQRQEVSITDPSKVTSVKAFIGKDFEASVTVPAGNTSTGWNIDVPSSSVSGDRLLLRFVLTNGDEYETGVSDFVL
jgi:hypothetical protein